MPSANRDKWNRELDWLLAPLEHIIVREPGVRRNPDGSEVEIMVSIQREDIRTHLPFLRELDTLLLDTLDAFDGQTFIEYVKPQQDEAMERGGKWWIEVPRLVNGTLSESEAERLNQALKCCRYAADHVTMINEEMLDAMAAPSKFLETLPERTADIVGRELEAFLCGSTGQGGPGQGQSVDVDALLEHQSVTTPEHALALLDKLQRLQLRLIHRLESNPSARSAPADAGRLAQLHDILPQIKQRFPGLRQTTVETARISENLDVGMAALEAYSRVLESRAASVHSRVSDVLSAQPASP
mmetsp:Transcript_29343/g.69042  ORF Transcript_29343/g.69042 Transcript_29343/m.69042 type:complete len:299 (+) Transcript_29343:281-1177(+)